MSSVHGRSIQFLALLFILLASAGCSGVSQNVSAALPNPTAVPAPTATPVPAFGLDDLIKLVHAVSGTLVMTEEKVDHGFAIQGTRAELNGRNVWIYQFSSEGEVIAAAKQVSPDGINVTRRDGNLVVQRHGDWIDTPHFYQKGRLIVIYAGKDAAMMKLLSQSMGPQFAGGSETSASANPKWVDELIAQWQSEPVSNPPRAIYRTEYKSKTVYYVRAACCDQYSQLYDEQGEVLCAPDGGITGKGDGKCIDFGSERKELQLIWQDSRNR